MQGLNMIEHKTTAFNLMQHYNSGETAQALVAAEYFAEDVNQDCENETTEWTFDDGSVLRLCNGTVEEITQYH